MRKLLSFLLLSLVACSSPSIEKQAASIVRKAYGGTQLLHVSVDTVTLGDNLDYRIEQARRQASSDSADVRRQQRYVNEFRGTSFAKSYNEYLKDAESKLSESLQKVADLDSLKRARLDIADTPAAYQCCVIFDDPMNIVWLQLSPDGKVLKMSRSLNDLYLNPGADMPGYLDLVLKSTK